MLQFIKTEQATTMNLTPLISINMKETNNIEDFRNYLDILRKFEYELRDL